VDDVHTFLFMDLVGFVALTAEQGDDSAAEVALRLYSHVRRLLPEHDGEEIKTIGDAMMVRCEDPRQAVDLGLRISERIEEEPDYPSLRIAVHTGTAVSREGDWYGSAVNVAARLCCAAGGGEVLVSEATRHAAGSPQHVIFGERQLHWLKNVPEPVAAQSVAPCGSAPRMRGPVLRTLTMKPRTRGLSARPTEVTKS
jgi:adenylate cyclase